VEGVFSRAEERSRQIAEALRSGVESSIADANKTLSQIEGRALSASEALRQAVAKAGDEASQALEGAFGNAEERAKDAASRLRGSIGASVSDVERMLAESGKKSDGVATQLREAMRQAIDEAINRFSGATDDIRRSAGEIRKELDMTREELKRGAFDLPEEAKENAAVMRRAVAEQIKALQELSEIIGKSSTHLEVAQPVRQQPALAAPAPVVPAPVAPQEPAAQQPAIQQQPAVQPQPAAPAPALRGSLGLEQATRPLQPARPTAAEERVEEGGGWMRDLLRAASREEEPQAARPRPAESQPVARAGDSRNPRHVVESLNSLSVDIARAIDHDASVELWRRYQRGERDVFTRRLYTLKGQQTFDEIKRKYDREPEFRTAVDRYIADFEKLLADVARNDPDKRITQTYLTSDTGKVYTMLAHAAGRFS
jgi:ElaB/YqjD/DUF883 family membrane-anchored ribosome-binding protein